MSKLDAYQRTLQLLLTGLTLTLIEFTKGGVVNLTKNTLGQQAHGSFLVIAGAIIVILIIYAFEFVAGLTIECLPRLRKLIMWDKHIEGCWIDAVHDTVNGKDSYTGGFLEIYYHGGELRVAGQTFDIDGRKIGVFNSHFVHYENSTLSFHYYKGAHQGEVKPVDGYAHYRFHPKRPYPDSFDGFFVPEYSSRLYTVHGTRVDAMSSYLTDGQKGKQVAEFVKERFGLVGDAPQSREKNADR